MDSVHWTRHALDALAERDIDREEVERAIREPDSTRAGHAGRTVHLRVYADRVLGRPMLLCVVTEPAGDALVVVTVYKTSKSDKYR